MTDTIRLGGEANPNNWYFAHRGQVGPLPNPVGHTFPLLTHGLDNRWQLVGTGFYISDDGVFVTARHNIDAVFKDGRQVQPLVILHLRSATGLWGAAEFLLRPILQCWLGDKPDVALGVAASATNNDTGEVLRNWTWTLSWSVPPDGSPAATYAFPNHAITEEGRHFHFAPDSYEGTVQCSGAFRDRVMAPFPYLQVDFRIHGAASGGPIISAGDVVGVNCTEWPNNIDHPPGPGFGVQSRCLAGAFLEDVILRGETAPRRVTFGELVRAEAVCVSGFSQPSYEELATNGSLVRLALPAVAPPPSISLSIDF